MIDKRDMDRRMCHPAVTHKGRVFDVVYQICKGWTRHVAQIYIGLWYDCLWWSCIKTCGSIVASVM